MAHVIEPTLRELLWSWLADNDYQIAGEVSVGDGRIDIVGKAPNGEYHGFEVKDQKKLDRDIIAGTKPERVRELFQQLNRYRDSGYLDKLYYCSQDPRPILERLESSEPVFDLDSLYDSMTSREGVENSDVTISPPHGIGFVQVPFDLTRKEKPTVLSEAKYIGSDTQPPDLSRSDESWVQHHVWEKFGTLREGVLPQQDGDIEQRIDVMCFEGSADPTKILNEQDEFNLVGIEVKGRAVGENTREQLDRYLSAGGITELYLAVPKREEESAREVLGEQTTIESYTNSNEDEDCGPSLSDVGLLTVNTEGDVEVVRRAQKLQMRYDGIRTPDTVGQCKAVGWGIVDYRECTEFDSVFDQIDN